MGKALLHLLVKSHIGPPEPIDGLLRIADQKKLAGDRPRRPPVRFLWLIRGEKQEYLRLEGIGVLEFIDEEMAEALL
jgi:hypothetical protein